MATTGPLQPGEVVTGPRRCSQQPSRNKSHRKLGEVSFNVDPFGNDLYHFIPISGDLEDGLWHCFTHIDDLRQTNVDVEDCESHAPQKWMN